MGLLYIKPFSDGGMIGLWETSDLKMDELGATLTPEQQQELKEIKSDKRKAEWLSVRLLFDAMRSDKDWLISYHASGKPYLLNSDHSISITHSGKYTAILLSPLGKAGIDIQCFNPSIMNAPDYFLTEKELAEIGEENRFILYHLYWCAKETLYKCFSESDPDIKSGIYIYQASSGLIKGRVSSSGKVHETEIWTEQTPEYMLTASVVNEPSGAL